MAIGGRVATPADSDWSQCRAAWNLAADQRPAAVAFVEDAADIAAVVGFAAKHELGISAQGTGHGAFALASLEETILIKTERMRGVAIDAEAGRARVEAGTLAAGLGAAAQVSGLCSLPGSAPDVGVIGYTLGGGLSWLGRRFGFACNRVSAIELITAEGEQRTVDAERDAELFWALRGGGGGYAIVAALQLELLPIGELYAGALLFPAELGADGIRAYRDWAAASSEDVTSIVRFLRPPPLPDVPEAIRDRPLLTIGAACLGGRSGGERAIAALRQIGEPIIDSFDQIPASALSTIHMDPEHPVPGLCHHLPIATLTDEAIDAFVSVAGPEAESPLLLTELRQLGGALARPDPSGGALSHLDADFVMLGVGMPLTPALGEAIDGHLDLLEETMRPYRAAGGYLNFAERPCAVDAILPAPTCSRLAAVKRRWDPQARILANHAVF